MSDRFKQWQERRLANPPTTAEKPVSALDILDQIRLKKDADWRQMREYLNAEEAVKVMNQINPDTGPDGIDT